MLTATRIFLLFFSKQASLPKGHIEAQKLRDEIELVDVSDHITGLSRCLSTRIPRHPRIDRHGTEQSHQQ